MHYIDRLIKFILLFFVFCCFSQISFGQVDTLVYETFDNGVPSDWYNVGYKWTETTNGEVRFEPSLNSEKGELIMPNLSVGLNDSIILELDHTFICDVAKNDSLYIDVSYDNGASYKDRLLIKPEDYGNPTINLTEELPNIVNNNQVRLKYVAILHENSENDVNWNLDKVNLYRLGGTYEIAVATDDVVGPAYRNGMISRSLDCLPIGESFAINVVAVNEENSGSNVPISVSNFEVSIYVNDIKYIVQIDSVYKDGNQFEYVVMIPGMSIDFKIHIYIDIELLNITDTDKVELGINITPPSGLTHK